MLYFAEIQSFEELSAEYEMDKIELFDIMPSKLTYPLIQPELIAEAVRRNVVCP